MTAKVTVAADGVTMTRPAVLAQPVLLSGPKIAYKPVPTA